MNVAQNVTITAILFGMLVLGGHPVLAVAADPGNKIAQVQGQQDEEAASGQPDDQPPATIHRGMGAGMMGGAAGGMGQGMMSGGMGPMCPMMARTDKDLSPEQVRDILEGQIAWTGNKRLKVGSVEQKDDETYVAEIVTVDDSLVQKLEVNRSTGASRPID